MEMIKELSEMSVEEVFGACKYARMAVLHKDDQGLASMFHNMTEQEISHSESLYSMANAMLEKHKDSAEYAAHRLLLDFIRGMQVDKVNEARRYLAQAKGA